MKHARRWLVPLVVWLVLLEGAAWIVDAATDYRYVLLDRLETAERSSTPHGLRRPDWPAGTLRVRVPDRGEPRAEPYALGGRVIEGAWPDAKQELVTPADLAGDARPRVFVLGGSAALGCPYRFEDSLAERLQARLPAMRVVNAAQVGWTSGQARGVAERIVEAGFEPAVFVVYSGNNEWIHWSSGPPPAFDPALQRTLATSRALAGALYLGHDLAEARPPEDDPPSLFGFAHAAAHPDRTLDPAHWRRQRRAFLAQLRANLEAMRELGEAAGARVIFVTVPFQPRLQPSFHHPQPDALEPETAERVRALLAEAIEAVREERCAEAPIDDALALDPGPPLLHYLKAECLRRAGAHEEAMAAYAACRDRMVGNLGGRLAVNEVVREVGATAELVDAAALFAQYDARHARPYHQDLVHDDCHPTPRGHRLIADALARRLGGAPLERGGDPRGAEAGRGSAAGEGERDGAGVAASASMRDEGSAAGEGENGERGAPREDAPRGAARDEGAHP